jgi:membrane-associated phospholipid phosphatase
MIQSIYESSIAFIVAFQSLGTWLTPPMQLFSMLGNDIFFILVAPVIFWSIDAALGLRLGLFLMISASLNEALKLFMHQPRPYWFSPRVTAFSSESSFGIPSGHAQNAVVVWGTIASYIHKAWAWVTAIVLILLIGLSRMYLAVHFPSDVLAGWLIGAVLLWVLLKSEKPFLSWFKPLHRPVQLLLALAGSITLILLNVLARSTLSSWNIPQEWITNALREFPDQMINPLAINGAFSNAGAFFGLAAGAILLQNSRGSYNAGGPVWKRFVRYLVGLVGISLIYFGLSAIFPHGEDIASQGLRYLRYALVGFWVTYLAPSIFLALRLADRKTPSG